MNLNKNDVLDYLNLQNYSLESKFAKVNAEIQVNFKPLPKGLLYSFIEQSLKKYPNLDKAEFDQNDFEVISKNIISIKDKDDANKKRETIFEFYNLVVGKDILKMIEKYKGGKVNGIITKWKTLNPLEQYLVTLNPLYGLKCGNAAIDAEAMAISNYSFPGSGIPDHEAETEVNAFKHCAWNACSVSSIASASGNKWKGLKHTKEFTCAHEYEDMGNNFMVNNESSVHILDLYNNLVGRTYAYNTIGQTWLGNANNIPSNSTIKSAINGFSKFQKNRIPYSDIYTMGNPVLNWTGGNNISVWGAANDYFNSSISQKLVYFDPGITFIQ